MSVCKAINLSKGCIIIVRFNYEINFKCGISENYRKKEDELELQFQFRCDFNLRTENHFLFINTTLITFHYTGYYRATMLLSYA